MGILLGVDLLCLGCGAGLRPIRTSILRCPDVVRVVPLNVPISLGWLMARIRLVQDIIDPVPPDRSRLTKR